MSKLYFTTSLLCLTAAAACLPVGCASNTQPSESTGSVSSELGSTSLVISQVFGGGSTAGVVNQDFVEIFNPTKAAVALTGYSLQLGTALSDFGATADAIVPLTGSIKAGGYYLVGLAKATGGTNLPTTDATGTYDLSATDGKVLLANDTDGVACGGSGPPCAAGSYLDLVGWGAASQAEGVKVSGLDGGKGAIRKNSCTDTDNNSADFSALPPAARNSATAALTCGTTTKDAGGDATTPIGVTDPDLGDEDPFDSGIKTDAGKSNVTGQSADDSGCSIGAVGAGNASALGLLFAAGLAVAGRRRRRK